MDPYSSPYRMLNNNPYNPFPHSLLSAREFSGGSRDAQYSKEFCTVLTTASHLTYCLSSLYSPS